MDYINLTLNRNKFSELLRIVHEIVNLKKRERVEMIKGGEDLTSKS